MRKGQFAPRIKIKCECGNEFYVLPERLADGRGKFCSQACKYKYRKMPKRGIGSYVLKKENPTSFKPGIIPWNTGKKGVMPIPWNHKGDDVGYDALHDWVKREMGKAKKCEHCGDDQSRIEWANKSHEYKRDVSDWIQLCRRCHIKYDRNSDAWGVATEKFKLKGRRKK